MAGMLMSRSGCRCLSTPRRSVLVRLFSSYDERKPPDQIIDVETLGQDTSEWPDTRLGPLDPKLRRFPLPGLVGSHSPRNTTPRRSLTKKPSYDVDLLTHELPHERQSSVLEQFVTVTKELSRDVAVDEELKSTTSPFDILECVAHECPFFLRNDLEKLFPNQNLDGHNITVMTVSQRTKNSLGSVGSDTVCLKTTTNTGSAGLETDSERNKLVERFVDAATNICESLHDAGFWADFIDPLLGRPYLDHRTNEAQYETDERYRRYGFEIHDTGRCKVIAHHVWGTHSYVGCLFTNAPMSHPLVINLAKKNTFIRD